MTTFRDDPARLTERDRDEVEAFREFLGHAPGTPPLTLADEDRLLADHPGLLDWAYGQGPAPARMDRAYGPSWRCTGMGV